MQIHKITFNDFGVNTYLLSDATRECIIIDAACHTSDEEQQLTQLIRQEQLMPVKLINTHSHIDHILGNHFVKETYNIPLLAHAKGDTFIKTAAGSASVFGFQLKGTVYPDIYLEEGHKVSFGESSLDVLYTPGHADGSICLYSEKDKILISGDVLFRDSIGRTDLPTGDYDILNEQIKTKIFTLPDETVVYPGHGPVTSVGEEAMNNPFVSF
jgi:glyoxylase-like metal-dependent hydrolase (beta-lactamase superfamily II)